MEAANGVTEWGVTTAGAGTTMLGGNEGDLAARVVGVTEVGLLRSDCGGGLVVDISVKVDTPGRALASGGEE